MPSEPDKLTEEDLIALARLEGKPMPEHLKNKVLDEIRKNPEANREKELKELYADLESDPENESPELDQ